MIMNRTMIGVDVSAAVLELIALVLACRNFAVSKPVAVAAESGFMPPHVEAAAWRALAASSMIALFDSSRSGAESAILFYSVQREINLRNPVYSHMLLDPLHGLFGDPAVNDDCRAVLGFAGLEAVGVMEAVRSLAIREMAERFTRMEAARDASLPFILSWRDDEAGTSPPTEEQRVAMQEVFEGVQGLTTYIDQATLIDLDAVVQHTGYGRSTVEAVVDVFTFIGLTDIDEAFGRLFRGDNPLRTAPIVADTQGRRILVHDALALPAVREVIETRLKEASRQKAYEKHRGEWVENAAVDLLCGALPGAQVFRGFNYFVPDPRGGRAADRPGEIYETG